VKRIKRFLNPLPGDTELEKRESYRAVLGLDENQVAEGGVLLIPCARMT
jgi:hypothetical protein